MSPRLISIAVALGLLLVACGDSDDTASTTTMDDAAMDDAAMDESMNNAAMEMNMGDPNATRAEDVAGADLLTGTFELLDTRPQGYDDTTGTAAIARHDAGTTVTIELAGLEPSVEFIAHLHDGPCTDNGGDHYMFDKGGSTVPPNEIHLLFTSSADGSGFMTAENDMVAGPEGQSVVVHPVDLLDNKIACAQFPT